ncbi:aminoglycoside phosphotransferase [Pyrenophora tritici-repentis]|nr:aminoglycoside phosphotransferase [Pyrenophora tritici-repentis]
MDDGRELIAKLPNPNAGRPYFTTASEAATMDYLRNVLGIPVPKIYGYSALKDKPVGSEYILMERSAGVELDKLWKNMKDLPSSAQGQVLESKISPNTKKRFAIGPTTDRAFFDNGRDAVQTDQGPFDTYLRSCAARELACIEKSSTCFDQRGLFNSPNQYRLTQELKIRAVHDYLKVATQILPKDAKLSKPTLWHPDLHGGNIFVDPLEPTKIVIIGWQAVNIAPLFRQARNPALLDFDGPIPEGLKQIPLPDGFDDMTEEQQREAKNL